MDILFIIIKGCHCGCDSMVVVFTTTYAFSAYHHYNCELESRSWRGALDTTLCDKVCQWLATGRWFYPGTSVSSTNKTDRHDVDELLFKVACWTHFKKTCLLLIAFIFIKYLRYINLTIICFENKPSRSSRYSIESWNISLSTIVCNTHFFILTLSCRTAHTTTLKKQLNDRQKSWIYYNNFNSIALIT